MNQAKQQLHCVMDESDSPYDEKQRASTPEGDLSLIRFAQKHGLELDPESDFAKLSQTMGGKI